MDVRSLVVEAKAGNVDAFTDLVRHHQAMVFGSALASIGDVHVAEDISQQAFLTAWRNISKLRDADRFGGWLRGIVRFECSHHIRKRRVVETPLEAAATVADRVPGPSELAERQESLDRVLLALDALPAAEREATTLFYIADLSQRDVAAFLEIPVATVNNRLRSARRRLRQGGLLDMTQYTHGDIGPGGDFADNIGRIVRSTGPLVEIQAHAGQRPTVFDTIAIASTDGDQPIHARITHHGIHDTDYAIILSRSAQRSSTVQAGMAVRTVPDDEAIPLDHQAISTLIDLLRGDHRRNDLLETGIKAVDVFCPIPIGGLVGIVGDMQSGKMVLVEELIHRLAASASPISVLVFVESGTETAIIRQVEYRTSPSVSAIYLPVEDASADALDDVAGDLDAVIVITKSLADQERYPAIDPLRSRSRLVDEGSVATRHGDVTTMMRAALANGESATRTAIERYFVQPFFVAEAFTGKPGESVPLDGALADLHALVEIPD